MTMREQVLEFMKKHDQECPEKFRIPNPDVVLLRVRLIVEEAAELCVALHEQDVVKIMDACADLRYVIVGTAVAYGVRCEDDFGYDIVPGLVNPMYHPSAMIRLAYFYRLNERIQILVAKLQGSLSPLSIEDERSFRLAITTGIRDVMQEVSNFDAVYVIPGPAVFAEVHRSNMTKAKLDKHSKGGKVTKKGFTAPNFEQFVYRYEPA